MLEISICLEELDLELIKNITLLKLGKNVILKSRLSLNNYSPYEAVSLFIGENNINKFQIKKINNDDIDLSIRLLKK